MLLLGALLSCAEPEAPHLGSSEARAEELVAVLGEVQAEAERLAGVIPEAEDPHAALDTLMAGRAVVAEVGYVRTPRKGEQRLDAHAVRRVGEDRVHVPIDELQDYYPEDPRDSSGLWVEEATRLGPGWIGEHCDDVTMRRFARYATPMEGGGFVYADLDLSQLSERMHQIETGAEGYVVIRDEASGRYLVHHGDSDCVFHACSARSALSESLIPPDAVPKLGEREQPPPSCRPPAASNRNLHVDKLEIPQTTWTMTVVSDPTRNQTRLRRRGLGRLLACCLAAVGLLGLLARRRKLADLGQEAPREDTNHETLVDAEGAPRAARWRAPASLRIFLNGYTAVLAAFLLGTLWISVLHPHDPAPGFTRVEDHHALQGFLDELAREGLEEREVLPTTVPTGLYVQSVTFQSSKEVLITGFVWQRYVEGVHDGVHRGFLLPESADATIEEIYRTVEDGTELIGWSFRVVINQEFDYRRFPFGQENIWIQLWHSEFTENVVLVPDFAAYKTTLPSRRPGVRGDLEVPGWQITKTWFGYRYRTYDTSFGARSFKDLTHFPELHYNIIVRPEIVQPLVAHILPIAVMVGLLFAILLLSSRYRAKADAFGFNAMNAVAAGSGFFLVAVFSHADLRRTLSFRGINYLEYFYFLTYLVILVVVLNALLLSLTRIKWVHRYDNGLPKLLFWPCFLSLAIGATLWVYW